MLLRAVSSGRAGGPLQPRPVAATRDAIEERRVAVVAEKEQRKAEAAAAEQKRKATKRNRLIRGSHVANDRYIDG